MLPTLRRQINEALEAKSAELAGYGPPLDLGSEAERWVCTGWVMVVVVVQGEGGAL